MISLERGRLSKIITIFQALVALEPLVSLMSRLGPCRERISGDRHTDTQTHRHTHRHTDTHTDTQTKYSNPRCACAPRVNDWAWHVNHKLKDRLSSMLPGYSHYQFRSLVIKKLAAGTVWESRNTETNQNLPMILPTSLL